MILDTSSSDMVGDRKSLKRDIDLITAILESGNSVDLPATGFSMFPTFMPGRRVVIKPLPRGSLPEPGSVVVFREHDVLVMHRLVEIIEGNNGKPLYITRGDSRGEADRPLIRQQIIGIAEKSKGFLGEHDVRIYVPRYWQYRFNLSLLWLYCKIKRATGFL